MTDSSVHMPVRKPGKASSRQPAEQPAPTITSMDQVERDDDGRILLPGTPEIGRKYIAWSLLQTQAILQSMLSAANESFDEAVTVEHASLAAVVRAGAMRVNDLTNIIMEVNDGPVEMSINEADEILRGRLS